jgi:hypothetical protein
MAEQLLVRSKDPSSLALVNEYLHDARYSLEELVHDETARTVSNSFRWDAKLRHRARIGTDVAWSAEIIRELHISNVDHITVEDPAGLVEHSFSKVTYDGIGTLVLLSNFPGSIQIHVSSFDMRLIQRTVE